MRTRKWLAWVVVETPSSDSIAAALKRLFLDYGLPADAVLGQRQRLHLRVVGRPAQRRLRKRIAWRICLGHGVEVPGTLGVRVCHAIVRRARSKIIEPNFGRDREIRAGLSPEHCAANKPTARPERLGRTLDQHEAWLREERPARVFRTINEVAGSSFPRDRGPQRA